MGSEEPSGRPGEQKYRRSPSTLPPPSSRTSPSDPNRSRVPRLAHWSSLVSGRYRSDPDDEDENDCRDGGDTRRSDGPDL